MVNLNPNSHCFKNYLILVKCYSSFHFNYISLNTQNGDLLLTNGFKGIVCIFYRFLLSGFVQTVDRSQNDLSLEKQKVILMQDSSSQTWAQCRVSKI